MELINAVGAIGTLLVAVIGVWVAVIQLRTGHREAQALRMAEMSWQIYQAYVEPRIRSARGAAEVVSTTEPIPRTGSDYGRRYGEKERKLEDSDDVDTSMRRLLRFYNQVGILVDKGLVDEDLVFALIGPGLKTGWPAVRAAVEWYQNYEGGFAAPVEAELRPIHMYIPILYQKYLTWEKQALRRLPPLDSPELMPILPGDRRQSSVLDSVETGSAEK